jgi:hypothetical protein
MFREKSHTQPVDLPSFHEPKNILDFKKNRRIPEKMGF